MTTPTPEPTDVEALLAKVAGEHSKPLPWRCIGCDWVGWDDEYPAHVAAMQAAALVPWVAQQRADALREAAEEWRTEEPQRSTHAHVRFFARELDLRADRIAPTTEAAPAAAGICGATRPPLGLPGANGSVVCMLKSGHTGWHHGDDGSDWTPRIAPTAEPHVLIHNGEDTLDTCSCGGWESWDAAPTFAEHASWIAPTTEEQA